MRFTLKKYSFNLFRFGVASIFFYFGILAILNPGLQAQIWIAPNVATLIAGFAPLGTFMLGFGLLQVLVGLSIVSGYMYRLGLLLAAAMLFGIIFNLFLSAGFNDVVLRDIIILTGVIYMLML